MPNASVVWYACQCWHVTPERIEMCSQLLVSNLAFARPQPAHQRHLHAAPHRHLDGSAKRDQFIARALGSDATRDISQDFLDRTRVPAERTPHRHPCRTRRPRRGKCWMNGQCPAREVRYVALQRRLRICRPILSPLESHLANQREFGPKPQPAQRAPKDLGQVPTLPGPNSTKGL